MSFTTQLLTWYHKNKRDLPWRGIEDPYKIWLSEVILQQTRVEQGLPYYQRFIEKYPDFKKLALADEKEILKLWQGLGYYSRGRNLLEAARQMVQLHKGFPDRYEDIRKLKGIGDYTAAAISSIAFNQPYAVVDGNVYRFLSRYFGVSIPIDSQEGKKTFRHISQELLDRKKPGDFNQAMMEFGATICKPRNPLCNQCIFNASCYALQNKDVGNLPVKSKKITVRNRWLYYLFISYKGKTFIRQRNGKDIWKGLFEFPLIETSKAISVPLLLKQKQWKEIFGSSKFEITHSSKKIKHQLSHQSLHATFIHVELETNKSDFLETAFKKVRVVDLKKYGMPQLIVKYLSASRFNS